MKESRPNGFCKDFTYKLFFIFYDIKSRNEQLLAHVTESHKLKLIQFSKFGRKIKIIRMKQQVHNHPNRNIMSLEIV